MIMVCVHCTLLQSEAQLVTWKLKLFSFPQLPLPTQGSAIYFRHFHLLPYIFWHFHLLPYISVDFHPPGNNLSATAGQSEEIGPWRKIRGIDEHST